MAGTRMQQRRGTAQQWASANPVLAPGEMGEETDTGVVKFGDGSTNWNSLKGIGYLPLNGKAADSELLDGFDSAYFATAAFANGINGATSANRKLEAHWGSVTAFPTANLKVGDQCLRTDIGTGGSTWSYVSTGANATGWVCDHEIVCTSTTRPPAGVLYRGLRIYETDSTEGYRYDGATWMPQGRKNNKPPLITSYNGSGRGCFWNQIEKLVTVTGEVLYVGAATVSMNAWTSIVLSAAGAFPTPGPPLAGLGYLVASNNMDQPGYSFAVDGTGALCIIARWTTRSFSQNTWFDFSFSYLVA
jgi:hypothetical protein